MSSFAATYITIADVGAALDISYSPTTLNLGVINSTAITIGNTVNNPPVNVLGSGTWTFTGGQTVDIGTGRLIGGADPATDGRIAISNTDAITFKCLTEGRYAINTFDVTFNAVVDHVWRSGYNNGASGNAHDNTKLQWCMQFESHYKAGPATDVLSEWFLQYRPPAPSVNEYRPIGAVVNQTTGMANVTMCADNHYWMGGDNTTLLMKMTTGVLQLGLQYFIMNTPISQLRFLTADSGAYLAAIVSDADDFLTFGGLPGGNVRATPAVRHAAEVRDMGPAGTKSINVESITANRTLVTGTDSQVQVLTPDADRDVILPAVTCTGLYYWVENQAAGGSGFDLAVKDPAANVIVTLAPHEGAWVKCTGAAWVKYGHVALVS